MVLPLCHPLFLFTERTEEIFHQSPFQEGPKLVDPSHFQRGKLAYLGIGMFSGSYRTFFLIQIDKHLDIIADVHVLCYITLWKQDFTFFTTVEIKSEIYGLYYSEGIVVSESEHVLKFIV